MPLDRFSSELEISTSYILSMLNYILLLLICFCLFVNFVHVLPVRTIMKRIFENYLTADQEIEFTLALGLGTNNILMEYLKATGYLERDETFFSSLYVL